MLKVFSVDPVRLCCRFVGSRKAAACPMIKYTGMKDRLQQNPAEYLELPCHACKALLEEHGFDPATAQACMDFAENAPAADGDGDAEAIEPDVEDPAEQEGEQMPERNRNPNADDPAGSFLEVVRQVSPFYQAHDPARSLWFPFARVPVQATDFICVVICCS